MPLRSPGVKPMCSGSLTAPETMYSVQMSRRPKTHHGTRDLSVREGSLRGSMSVLFDIHKMSQHS